MPFITLDNLIRLWFLPLYYRLKSAMQSQIDILPLWVRFLARAQLKMLRKLLVWPKGSMQTLTDKNLGWNLKGNFSRMRLLWKILDSILVSDIVKRGFLWNTYHKPMGAAYKDRILWGLLVASYININWFSLHGLPEQVKQINAWL